MEKKKWLGIREKKPGLVLLYRTNRVGGLNRRIGGQKSRAVEFGVRNRGPEIRADGAGTQESDMKIVTLRRPVRCPPGP